MNKIGKILVGVGITLLLIALIIYIYSNYMNNLIMKRSETATNKIEKIISDNNNNEIENTKNIDGKDYIGLITIPAININLPIQSTWNYNNLKYSPCIYYGSIEENNLVICAHGYKSQFGNLLKLIPEDQITITDLNGNKYTYEVIDKELIEPTDIQEVVDTEYDLTLFCCYDGVAQRVIIHCNRIN